MMAVRPARFRSFHPICALLLECNFFLQQGLLDSGGLEVLGHRAPKACCVATEAASGANYRSNQGGALEMLWQKFFSDPTQWWDNRRSKASPGHPDFRHKRSKEVLWLKSRCKPPWVKSQLARLDAEADGGMRKPSGSASIPGRGASGACKGNNWQVGTCRKLCEDGHIADAVDALTLLVQRGSRLDNNLFYLVLKRCIAQKDLVLGRRLHALSVENGYEGDAFLATHLIGLYASHGKLEEAMGVFSKVTKPSAYNWASIIFASAKHGEPWQAIGLYRQMRQSAVRPDNRIFVAVLKACASARDLAVGRDVHACIQASPVEPDMFVQTCLVDMYAKCGSLEDAEREFDRLPQKDVVAWTCMVAGYAQQGMGQKALGLYASMQQQGITPPDSVTFVSLLQACAGTGVTALDEGKRLHAQIEKLGFQTDVIVGNSLVNMYAKCGSLEDAHRLFHRLSHKNVVTWTAMIAGYAQQGLCQEALSLYDSMQRESAAPPNAVTFVCLLQACASAAALPLGKQLHVEIRKRGLQADAVVGRSLVNMYAKCGSLEDAQLVFDCLPEREIVAWGCLIAGYARRGDSEGVFTLVQRMRQDGIEPDGITLLSVLTVCSHVGLVDKGRKYFDAMSTDYGVRPAIEHYTCMVDLLGRAGHVDEALEMVKTMPFQPDRTVWLTLLGACQKWSNIEVGRQAFECAVRLDENDASVYVLMSNIYAGAQMWEEAQEMQARRAQLGARKQPGQSWWTDMNGVVHSFLVGDSADESEGKLSISSGETLKQQVRKSAY